ncbi:MAG: pimeloyl-ACP methyl ester esterase BioH [Gammaproteobacteria bacterium]|jgi:pimeloyl-[acyl-carrier protein] methyl ester esterase|nr:pimeloyl-ACP methyl ester esterase BioH [Gammaproteobacteria bacterium]MBT3726007.1 pimeloyl-ACP methyl ester esterase BioH [Gammaproteobacteria bacterium]MBT4075138.1 pimeloyl-ACP methyl ester esterase BioH [Gammaproteobacteria bacterium]MBT4195280.1 pimeloyl-ACP methyl ester esterase BioH [Gammaproteobacteria bacterium]MBT4448623.1 pimeloyl-ACP methyl ester esterase BioH [Gammaproteobacteria bacterium]
MNKDIKTYQQGEGHPLTLIHGWGMNSAVFEPLAQKIANDFRITRVDLPGHGRSGWSGQASFDEQVDALAAVVPDSTLVGWSLGGLYALRLVNRYPEKFNKLILVSCNPCFVQRPDWQTAVDASVFAEFSASLIENWRLTIRRFLGLQMYGVDQARTLIRQISELLIKGGVPDPEAMQFGLDLLLQLDARNELQEIKVPVMEILGQRDTLVPAELADQLPLINPEIRVECLARSAHAPFLSNSDLFAGLIREFVKPSST